MDNEVANITKVSTLKFRAVRTDEGRHGIRLEEIFWRVLNAVAAARGIRLKDVISERVIALGAGENLSSSLRAYALESIWNEVEELRSRMTITSIENIVRACPSPAFALSSDKKIIAFNQSFLNFVQSRLAWLPSGVGAHGLRLSLDTQFPDLVASLKASDNRAKVVGYVIGAEDRVLRGKLNALLAPIGEQDAVIGYILPA